MSVASQLGLGPTRSAKINDDGTWTLTVTANKTMIPTAQPRHLRLTADQYARFCRWCHDGSYIQVALPDLSGSERELIITGLSEEDFDAMTEDWQDDDEP